MPVFNENEENQQENKADNLFKENSEEKADTDDENNYSEEAAEIENHQGF